MEGISIYDDDVIAILKDCGSCTVQRASHVEALANLPEEVKQRIENKDPSLWWVDFSPVNENILLGPFESRQDALDAEKEWLENYLKNSEGRTRLLAAFS